MKHHFINLFCFKIYRSYICILAKAWHDWTERRGNGTRCKSSLWQYGELVLSILQTECNHSISRGE